ncbi:hypothetical protein RAZWK3B_15378 [Roseobacter sp. AzwK-3b]|uniref:DUF1153 domain-containing protein n=1 Tax=Roseobacter sp. AzwK-3b TaxID=351016 RepID=UPI000156A3B5|nr:DUF1153 domain-containing protein [Roseobacter sp. AzwK-3b]EDM70791.1 hypothetical protein RAZWK3B_15378 [Roseobacter sp. AzwK-3b]
MFLKKVNGPRMVTLPDGSILSRGDLPPADTRRWTARRKMAVVRGVVHGLMSQDEAQSFYELSEAELAEWLSAAEREGTSGLRATVRTKEVYNLR